MRAQVTPATSFELTERVQGGGDGAPVPLNVGAVDAADALFAKVGSWVGAFAEELTIPALSIRAYMVNNEIQGLRALAPIPASELTGQLTKWLSRHIDQIAASPTAATFHDDIWGGWEDSPGVTKLLGRYGSEGRKPKDALKRECPICGKREVFAAHPSLLNPDPMVLCGLCGWLANMEKFPHAKEMFESA
jgi:ribosomal protein S27AE